MVENKSRRLGQLRFYEAFGVRIASFLTNNLTNEIHPREERVRSAMRSPKLGEMAAKCDATTLIACLDDRTSPREEREGWEGGSE